MKDLIEQLLNSDTKESIRLIRDFDKETLAKFKLDAPSQTYVFSPIISRFGRVTNIEYTDDIEAYKDLITQKLIEVGTTGLRSSILCFFHESSLYQYIKGSYPIEYENVTPETNLALFNYAERVGVEDGKFFTCAPRLLPRYSDQVEASLDVAHYMEDNKLTIADYDGLMTHIGTTLELATHVGSYENTTDVEQVACENISELCSLLTGCVDLIEPRALDIIRTHLIQVGAEKFLGEAAQYAYPVIYNNYDASYTFWNSNKLEYDERISKIGEFETNLEVNWNSADAEDMVFLFVKNVKSTRPKVTQEVIDLRTALITLEEYKEQK